MRCTEEGCLEPLSQQVGGEFRTLVGYHSPLGHTHDDNCRKRAYICAVGHTTVLSKQNRCPFPGCGWKGKAECFCHPGAKVIEWPEEVARRLARESIPSTQE